MSLNFTPIHNTYTSTIAINTSLGSSINLGGDRPFAIIMPAAWDAASLTFQASADGTNYYEVTDTNGNAITITASASIWIVLDPIIFAGINNLNIRSGTSGTPVNQTAARTITLVTRPI